MAITDYDSLQTAIAKYAWRTDDSDFEDSVPDFIAGVEHTINYGMDLPNGDSIPPLRVADMETTSTVAITSGAGTLPTDYLQWRRVKANTSPAVILTASSPDLVAEYDSVGATYPKFFDIIGTTITTYPASSADLSLTYYAKVPALSDNATTNWLLTKAPMVYLYGSLIHAAPFMMDDARATIWAQLYKAAISGLTKTDVLGRYARASVTVRGPTP